MKILTKDSSPFKTKQAAAIFAGRLKLEKGKFEIVPEGEGYAIESQVAPPEKDAKVEAVTVSGSEVITAVTTSEVEVKPAKKHRVTTPWKPATLLDIPEHLKDKDYVYRFCDRKREGNIQKKLAEGWEIDKELSKKMKQAKPTLEDGSNLDGTMGIRELVVMRMPKETAEARNKYYADKASGAMKNSAQELKKELGDAEYGDITVETY